ncbi:hypothetical protein [Nocardia crassostreae]|uniref:hypothetical protein n=1 Tax=Nocardia crassostreae TaxID=53428 RepID=UPI00082D0CF2|nr:hypothetical protein [Nocardia crassostreae]
MSLLDRGNEEVTAYTTETITDVDGNTITRPSRVGVVVRASVQPFASTEDNELGFTTRETYRLRIARGYSVELGAQAPVDWRGQRWSVIGEPLRFNGSRRTGRLEYLIERR